VISIGDIGHSSVLTSATHQLDPLTGLRGIAAYSVLVAHGIQAVFSYGGVPFVYPFAGRLALFGMSLFFVLSGFVIHYNYAETFTREPLGAASWRFFVARFARLYPLYAVSIIVSLPHIPAPNFSESFGVLLAYLTLTQSWFNVEHAIFAPAWSISTEWFFYVAFIPLATLIPRTAYPALFLNVYCLVVLVSLLVLLNLFAEPLGALVKQWLFVNDKVSNHPVGWLVYYAPPIRLLEFIAGMLAAKAYMSPKSISPRFISTVLIIAPLWCLSIVLLAPLTEAPLKIIVSNIIFGPALAPFMLCVCLSTGRFNAVLSSRLFLFMGEISYSVYVWSFFVMTLLGSSLTSTAWSTEAAFNSILKLALIVWLTTVFAYGSYVLIEVPSRRWVRAKLSRIF
jgi:peptidoglycan/LPS O-acetylase OafA/YrhL